MSDAETGGATPREQGAALLKRGRFSEAAAALRRAVEGDPGDEGAWRLLGGALASQGDSAGAIPAFEQAVALAPDSAKNHYNLAVALQADGKLPEARSHLEQALGLDPEYAQAKAALDSFATQGAARSDETPAPLGRTNALPVARDQGLASLGGSSLPPANGAGGTAIGGRAQGADDLAAVGGPAAPDAAPPASGLVGERTVILNVGPSAYGGAAADAPMPVLGQGYGFGANTSGQKAEVPPEIRGGWNWGAFAFGWIWLITHKMIAAGVGVLAVGMSLRILAGTLDRGGPAQIALGGLVSVLQLGMAIYLALAGNRLGWRNRRFDSVEDFRACQGIWAKWAIGLTVFILVVLAAILVPVFLQARSRARGF